MKCVDDNKHDTTDRSLRGFALQFRLARLTGRDPETLALCPRDEASMTTTLALALLVGPTVHWLSMVAALDALNTHSLVAIGVASVTATGVFAVDRAIVHATDLGHAESAIRIIGAANTHRLTGWMVRLSGKLLRSTFSLITAFGLVIFIGLQFHDEDLRAEIARAQMAIDGPLLEEAYARLEAERSLLNLELENAEMTLSSLQNERTQLIDMRATRVDAAEANVARIRSEIEATRQDQIEARNEADRQWDISRCEIAGSAPDCNESSGIPGEGQLYKLASDRANVAEARYAQFSNELNTLSAELERARMILESAQAPFPTNPAWERVEAEERLHAVADAIAEFERNLAPQAGEMVLQNPEREKLDPNSLADRIDAMGRLAKEPWFFASLIAIPAITMMIEMITLIVATTRVPADYSLRRGQQLAALSRSLVNQRLRDEVEDAELHADARRARRKLADEEFADAMLAEAKNAGIAGTTGWH